MSLPVSIKGHCLAIKDLKVFVFTKALVKNVLLWEMGEISGILHLCRKICKIDQYFLQVIAGSFRDSPKREK